MSEITFYGDGLLSTFREISSYLIKYDFKCFLYSNSVSLILWHWLSDPPVLCVAC